MEHFLFKCAFHTKGEVGGGEVLCQYLKVPMSTAISSLLIWPTDSTHLVKVKITHSPRSQIRVTRPRCNTGTKSPTLSNRGVGSLMSPSLKLSATLQDRLGADRSSFCEAFLKCTSQYFCWRHPRCYDETVLKTTSSLVSLTRIVWPSVARRNFIFRLSVMRRKIDSS